MYYSEAFRWIETDQSPGQIPLEDFHVGPYVFHGERESCQIDPFIRYAILLEASHRAAAGGKVYYPALLGTFRYPDTVDIGITDYAVDWQVGEFFGSYGGSIEGSYHRQSSGVEYFAYSSSHTASDKCI